MAPRLASNLDRDLPLTSLVESNGHTIAAGGFHDGRLSFVVPGGRYRMRLLHGDGSFEVSPLALGQDMPFQTEFG
jgi:hypothetical protein